MLHYKVAGDGTPIVLIHGLFGSLENVGAVARFLAQHFKVYSVDLPNHGRSPHMSGADLSEMANQVVGWMARVELEHAFFVGHSLGGKVAMEVALSHPDKVDAVTVIDIAPITYGPRHLDVFAGLEAVDPAKMESRNEADAILSRHVPELAVRSFLLKNLVKQDTGYEWRIHLPDIRLQYPKLIAKNRDGLFEKPLLFLKGGNSDYILPQYREDILNRFPNAQLRVIPDTGHWLHAEKPELTATLIRKFFQAI